MRGVSEPEKGKIFISPLKQYDSFGPTESHVLNKNPQHYFIRLLDFDIPKANVCWVDSMTIYQKSCTTHLKTLLQTS